MYAFIQIEITHLKFSSESMNAQKMQMKIQIINFI